MSFSLAKELSSEADGTSDIDILVDKGNARALAVCGLANYVYRSTGKMTDVFDVSELDQSSFRDSVLRDAVALFLPGLGDSNIEELRSSKR